MNATFYRLLGLVAISISALGQSKRGSLEGVWQAVEVKHGMPATTLKPGPNLTIFSARHYSRVDIQADNRPALENPSTATAEQLRATWGPLVAEAGSYELKDGLVTLRPAVSKNPAAMAPDVTMVYAYKLDGDTLTLTAQRDRTGPVAVPLTVKLMRIE